MKSGYKTIEELVVRVDERNLNNETDVLLGVSINKCFIPSVANTIGTDLTKYKLIRKDDFAVSLMQVSRDSRIPIARQKEYEVAIISPAYPIFRVKNPDEILPEYLEMWFKRDEFDREAAFIAVGGVRGSMPWNEFAQMQVYIPQIEEQRKIVEAFKSVEDRIEIKQRINDNLEAQANSLFEQLTNNFENMKPIHSFGKVITGKTPPTAMAEYYGNDVPFIKTPDMHGNVYITTSECSLSKIGADSQVGKYIPANTVVVACIGANAGEVALTSYIAQTNQQINSVISKYPCFLYFSIKAHTAELRALGDGSSTMININKTSFENYKVPTPNTANLDKLENMLSSIFAPILSNLHEIDMLNEVRSLLITRLSR